MWRVGGSAVLLLAMSLCSVGCETKAGTGAIVGGLGGAGVGGLIGSLSHRRAGEGALIGGVVGAIGGALVGNEMDKSDERAARHAEHDAPRYAQPEWRTSGDARVTKEEVIGWAGRGTRDEVIIDRIERSGTVFALTAADENRLRDAGVSEQVIRAMKDTARRY